MSNGILRFFRDHQYWERMTFFCGVALFKGLSARQLGRLTQFLQHRVYQAGETVFVEGQQGKAVYIVESGQVELVRQDSHGRPRRLALLGPGQIFGEMALLDNLERTASAVMVEDGVIHLLYSTTFESIIKRYPDVGVIVLRNVATLLSMLLRRANAEADRISPAAEAA